MDIKKSTALVTGANRGIGNAILKKLVRKGIQVIGTSTTLKGVEMINNDLKNKGFGILLNLQDPNSIEKKIKNIYHNNYSIDILINNAAISEDKLLIKMKNQEWKKTIDINLNSIFYTSRSVIGNMIKNRYGRIITIGSIIGNIGNKGQTHYSTAKSGIIGFHKSLALEVAKKGITVNIISPGIIKTDMIKNCTNNQYKKYLSMIPIGRFGLAEEIADAVIFLSSQSASYITGHTLHINGGMYMT